MPSLREGIRGGSRAAVLVAVVALGGCGSPTPTGTAIVSTGSPVTTPGVPQSSDAAVVPKGTLTIAVEGALTNLSNAAADEPTIAALPFIFNGLYRYNASLAPMPDLAAELCDVSDDEITWTCMLTEASFHNGDRVMAADVAFTYQLAMSPTCTFRPALCLSSILRDVEAVDESTIVFKLKEPYAPFGTVALTGIKIESKTAIERAFATLVTAADELDLHAAESLTDDLETLEAGGRQVPACADAVAQAEELLRSAPSLRLPVRDDFNFGGEGGDEFDPCAYASALGPPLRALVAAGEPEGPDAIAAAYPFLNFNAAPIGTGPWLCMPGCLRPGESLTLTAFDGYFRGPPATETIIMPTFADELTAIEALRAGEVDWVRDIRDDAHAAEFDGEPMVKLGTYPDLGYFSLQYNLREGQLFADLGARKAVQHCIDKQAIVESVTRGRAIPMDGYISPVSWAHNANLPAIERDTRAGMDYLRQADWNVEDADDDGIADALATRGNETFSTQVYVRGGQPERILFMEQLRDQVSDCGIDLEIIVAEVGLMPLLTFPHAPPGADQFDAYFGGWGGSPEPDPYLIFHSSQCTTADQPQLFNYICFANEDADRLIAEGRRVSDLEQRSEIYRELQQVLYEQQPYLFAWSDISLDATDANLTSSAGDVELGSPLWHWQLETLVITE